MDMDKEKLVQRLIETFLGELEEHARSFNRDLLALEGEPPAEKRAEILRTLFRTAHSLKGASRSVGVGHVEAACHKLEGIIEGIRDGHVPLRPELFQLLFATVDGVEEVGTALREQRDLSGVALVRLLPRLESAGRATAAPPRSPPLAAFADAPRPDAAPGLAANNVPAPD